MPSCAAQFPPSGRTQSNLTTILSPVNGNISIVYKSPPPGTCTTVFPTQKQYTGYVELPPFTLAPLQQNYSINTFFWFIEARDSPETAPLTIWLNGGPATSSMIGLFEESGPCEVIEMARGVYGTQARQWGWDRTSNMIYVDQPNQVGFSYETPVNASLNLLTGDFEAVGPVPDDLPAYSYLNGTFSLTNNGTTNTTEISAYAIWHMLQGFLGAFPQYNPGTRPRSNVTGDVGINLFTESYGGKYGPAFASVWEEQNARRQNGSISSNGTLDIRLRSLGIINGCIDELIQSPFYSTFASNNTYGIQAVSNTISQNMTAGFYAQDGCENLLKSCRNAIATSDPQNIGNASYVNELCAKADLECTDNVQDPYYQSGRGAYDIRHFSPDPFPPSSYLEYLNTADVLEAIGARINFTSHSDVAQAGFTATGDGARGGQIGQLSYLLSQGVRVALIYGDADYICNWLGGEAASFSVASQASYMPFYSAGYADIQVNDSYVGGAVRSYGNLSFSRIYDSGHLVPAYQPETAFTVFTRIVEGANIATGETVDLSSFGTQGDANATHTNKDVSAPSPTCWIRDIASTCTDEQKAMIMENQGVVMGGVLYDKASDYKPPSSSVAGKAGKPGALPTAKSSSIAAASHTSSSKAAKSSSSAATGVYVATAAPKVSHLGVAGAAMEVNLLALGLSAMTALIGVNL
ncbi:MAG: hypothetical protein M1819_005626 [Sarea resinae]|nr:MAG: hypothetical protein M1819_005626 [Sarea resinae]